jgi:hypothetical protein
LLNQLKRKGPREHNQRKKKGKSLHPSQGKKALDPRQIKSIRHQNRKRYLLPKNLK